jgi:hypothetical protein
MKCLLTPLRKYELLLTALFLTPLTPTTDQQSGAPPVRAPSDRVNAERQRQQDMSKREYQLRNFGTEPPKASNSKQREALMLQTEEDFNRILLLHNQIVRAISSDRPLDYMFVSDAAAEIKKRASRLQGTLALKEDERQKDSVKPPENEGGQLKDSLLILCKEIKSFVTNPVIETPGTVNAEQLEKARHDLAIIIKLSGVIKRDADKLSTKAQ